MSRITDMSWDISKISFPYWKLQARQLVPALNFSAENCNFFELEKNSITQSWTCHLSCVPGLHVASQLVADERIPQLPTYWYAATQSKRKDVVLLILFCFFFSHVRKNSLSFILDNCDWILLFGVTHIWSSKEWLADCQKREICSKLTICSEDKRNLSSVSLLWEAKLRLLGLHRNSNNCSDIKSDLVVAKDKMLVTD